MGPSGHFYSILFICGPGVVVVKIWNMLYLGRAPRTKEALSDFHGWCRVTRHPRLFRRLTGSQRTPGFWGVTNPCLEKREIPTILEFNEIRCGS